MRLATYLSNFKKRLVSIPNRILWRLLFPNSFSRHPEVHDWSTNPSVGFGLGLARTTDVVGCFHALKKYGRPVCQRQDAVLDLGSGDGVALRLMRLCGFRNVVGIEADSELAALSRINEPTALIIEGDFTLPMTIRQVSTEVRLVFAFNPAPPEQLLHALVLLLRRLGAYRLILFNPIAKNMIQEHGDLSVLARCSGRNFWVADVGDPLIVHRS